MSNLTVIERSGVLVVDSRLIADRLAIAHKNLLATLDKYKQSLEPTFGKIAFETRKSERGKPERFAWLTEEQATFLMTLSRNTDEVVQCKLELVKAFSKAKRAIQEVIPAQAQEIERLKLELALAQTQERLMLTSQALVTLHGTGILALILGKPDAVVERVTEIEKTTLVEQSGRPIKTYRGLSKTKLAKRYGFKKPQDLVNWLQSIDKLELLQPALTAAPCQYMPYEFVAELDRLRSQRQGLRQRLLGE